MPRRLLISLLLFAPLVFAQGLPEYLAGAVEGVVLNESGKPIPGASVYCNATFDRNRLPSTISDPQGRFLLEGVPPGPEIAVVAHKEKAGYLDVRSAFFKTSERDHAIVKVEAGKTTRGVVIYPTRGARLKLEITDRDGARIDSTDLGLEFTRDDEPVYGRYLRGAGSPHFSMLVPPVPFQFTVSATGYKPWSSGRLSPRSGTTLSFKVRMDRK
jgi:hypothetical protein